MEQDPQEVEATREQSRLRSTLAAQSEVSDIQWLMNNKRGRRILHRLLDSAGVFRISFDTNALRMAFNEGNRNQGNQLLALITTHCPERYVDLMTEAKDK